MCLEGWPAVEAYHNPNPANTPNTPRYRGISYTKPIDAAKEAVPVIDLADRLAGPGKFRKVGETWSTNCVLPGHEDRVPSFVVYPETNSFYCFGCLRGGDVVELARLAWGYDERDAHIAAAELLMEFGYEVTERAPAWFRKQERQKKARDALHELRVRSAQRRLMRTLTPLVTSIEDPEARREEAQRIWRDLAGVARLLVKETTR
jgi:DNA primase